MSLTLLATACGQVEAPAQGGVIVVSAASAAPAVPIAASSVRAVTADFVPAESREQDAIDLAGTDRYPTLPPDRLELARDIFPGDGTDGV
ncbi:hypothetical protein K7957_07755 [Sphingomonas yunnanensis]|uniref:hypothetical protein n=1 Tax=Sphingomonas yunnanensis TaxID=310400 RepID=UPI001CA61075|nr:hypothetical protein [Sphingomonas yunnanensis]MBY9062823.1 hypothetical protein [Sphingomonas yunnanensis]